METKKCLKCRSENSLDAAYCRFCHERFERLKTFIEKIAAPPPRQRFSRRIIVAVGSLLAIAASFIFRRRTSRNENSDRMAE